MTNLEIILLIVVGFLSVWIIGLRWKISRLSERQSVVDTERQAVEDSESTLNKFDEENELPDLESPEARDARAKMRKAYELLRDVNIAEILPEMLDWRWLYKSTEGIDFETSFKTPQTKDLRDAARIRCEGHEIIIAAGKFDHVLPRFDPETKREEAAHGDAYVFFDEEEVLRLTVFRKYVPVPRTELLLGPAWIKHFKAGPWLEMLNDCYPKLKAIKEKSVQEYEDKQTIDKAKEFDLGEYE